MPDKIDKQNIVRFFLSAPYFWSWAISKLNNDILACLLYQLSLYEMESATRNQISVETVRISLGVKVLLE